MIKKALINALAFNPIFSLGSKLYQHKVPVFMLHRMASTQLGVEGHEPELLRTSLAFLRKHDFNFVTIDDIALSISNQMPLPPKSVAFTLDDGYEEQIEIATNIFSEYDCPATFYVCTGFVDGDLWFWADKVQFLVESCSSEQLKRLVSFFPHLEFTRSEKLVVASQIIEYLKTRTLEEINRVIDSGVTAVDMTLPLNAPEKYSATSWSKLRAIEKRGMMVGAHSYSHPILSNENDDASKFEIERSTLDIKKNLQNPSNVFCYPVGRKQDFSQREIDFVRSLGYLAGISSMPGSMNVRSKQNLYSIPRFSFPDTKEDFVQYASWIESFKSQFRSAPAE